MSDHNANEDYPEFNAQSVADGYWEVYHDDDCEEAFDWFGGAVCPKCGFRPDMQSIAARKIHANQVPIKLSFDAPCSACGDGDTEMKHHNHEPLKAVSQSVERMTADQFYKPWIAKHPKLLGKSVTWPLDVSINEFAEAFAEHCTAAMRAELRVAIEDGDADFWKVRVESSAALIEEALEMFGLFGKLMGGELTKVTAWRKAAESLLSDPAVKKVLEK